MAEAGGVTVKDVTSHDFFKSLSWTKLENKQMPMPHVPPIKDPMDTSCFDEFPEEDNSSWDKYNVIERGSNARPSLIAAFSRAVSP